MHYKDVAMGFLPYARTMAKCKGTWLRASKGQDMRTYFTTDSTVMTPEQRKVVDRVKMLERSDAVRGEAGMNGNSMSLVLLDALATGLRDGPKIFCPTNEQFESMEHVDINLSINDYRQPYPAMVIKLPNESKRRLATKYGLNPTTAPTWCLVYARQTDAGEPLLVINTMFIATEDDFTYVFQDRDEFPTIEHALAALHPSGAEGIVAGQRFSRDIARACLNLMLMMTHYGHKLTGPLLPKEHAKAVRAGRSCSEDFQAVDMIQHVTIREHQPGHGELSVPTGTEKIPHWRRGHWRNQAHGPGWTRHKLLFVKPCLIRRDRVVGDLADAEAVYESRSN